VTRRPKINFSAIARKIARKRLQDMALRMGSLIWAALAPMLAGAALAATAAHADGTVAGDPATGQALAERLCARCHAISGPGPSPLVQAPPFSGFERQWPVYYLAEAMAEGLVIGHGPMPEFTFTPQEIEDLLAYLHSVQLGGGVVADGLALATEDCAACHRVQESQPQPPAVVINETTSQEKILAPSFREIARRGGRDAAYLRSFVQQPHYPMPEQQFIPEELNAIVGYIVSLKDSGGSW
jgi:mono/diheme cytochrome c family protein